jgi:uncharacterized protein YbbK (DUF523 family)
MTSPAPPTHFPSPELIASWPRFTPEEPLRLLVSACLAGDLCGVDGTCYGEYPLARRLLGLPNVQAVRFCPENAAVGTPRAMPDIHGGNGYEVLDGRARFLSDQGDDWTDAIVKAAGQMRDLALAGSVHLALLMDISAACGSTVIYQGARSLKVYQQGPGVAGAAIMRAGIPVVSQRDERTLALIFAKLGASPGDLLADGLDHHERPWFQGYFAGR